MPFSLSFTLLNADYHPLADLTPAVLSGSLVFNNTSGRTRTATLDLKPDTETENTAENCNEEEKNRDGATPSNKAPKKSIPPQHSGEGGCPLGGRGPLISSANADQITRNFIPPRYHGEGGYLTGGWGPLISSTNAIQIKNLSSPLALLLPTSSTLTQTSSGTILSLRLSDKYALLDGTLGGITDTDILVPAGSVIPDVICSLLSAYDPLPPVFEINNNAIPQISSCVKGTPQSGEGLSSSNADKTHKNTINNSFLPSSEGRGLQPVVNGMPVACQSRRVTEPQREPLRGGGVPLISLANANQSPVTSYEIRLPAGKPVSTLLEELADNMSCTCAYDPSGRLVFKEEKGTVSGGPIDEAMPFNINQNKYNPPRITGRLQPVVNGMPVACQSRRVTEPQREVTSQGGGVPIFGSRMRIELPEGLIISSKISCDYSSIVNDVLVLGATVNNQTFLGRAQNTNPASPTCISRLGPRTLVLSMPDYRTDELCSAYARRVLRDHLALSASTTLVLSPEAFPLLNLSDLAGYTLSFNPTTPLEVCYS